MEVTIASVTHFRPSIFGLRPQYYYYYYCCAKSFLVVKKCLVRRQREQKKFWTKHFQFLNKEINNNKNSVE